MMRSVVSEMHREPDATGEEARREGSARADRRR
jgi:hypothetical protein